MSERKPGGYWKILENCAAEAHAAMEKEGWETLPCGRILENSGYKSLVHAIVGYHGGFHQFRTLLGQRQLRRQAGLLKSHDYLIHQIREAMKKEGWTKLPSDRVLRDKGYSTLSHAIMHYHGGFPRFRAYLGQRPGKPRVKRGLWPNLGYAIQQAHKAMRKEGWKTLPNCDMLAEKGYSSLSSAIMKHHGGFHRFRKLLGQGQLKRKTSTWKDLAYATQQAHEALKREGWKILPGTRVLRAKGYNALCGGIARHHGGIAAFRRRLGQEQLRREDGLWKNLEYALQQASETMHKEGWARLPTVNVLREKGYAALVNAIYTYHGGLSAFRAKLNAALGINPGKEQLEAIIKEYLK
jgi:superoxide dismutase